MAFVLVTCQVLLLTVFATSVSGKVRSRAAWSGFVGSVRAMRLLPDRVVRAVAFLVVASEITVIPMLVVPAAMPAGLILAGSMLSVFAGAALVTVRRGVPAACQCFGPRSMPLGRRHVIRNGLLVAVVALAGAGLASAQPTPHLGGLAVAATAGLVGAVVLILFDEIVELFASPAFKSGPAQKGSA